MKISVLHKSVRGVLNSYKKTFGLSPKCYRLLNQAEQYVLYLFASRTGGFVKSGKHIYSFVFGEKIKGKNVVVFGAGTMGQHTYWNISAGHYCNPVLWVDEDYISYQEHGYNVKAPSAITDCKEFDYIIIAMLDKKRSECALLKLVQYGVPNHTILLPNVGEMRNNILEKENLKPTFA